MGLRLRSIGEKVEAVAEVIFHVFLTTAFVFFFMTFVFEYVAARLERNSTVERCVYDYGPPTEVVACQELRSSRPIFWLSIGRAFPFSYFWSE